MTVRRHRANYEGAFIMYEISFVQDFVNGFTGQWVYVLRLLLACLCGGAIGIERTLRQKDAGFRTHMIVAMGAALMTIVSKYGFLDVVTSDILIGDVRVDVSRVASNIITGISFLGAGMIFANGSSIKGLTTAAGILVTATAGMAIGAGLYTTGIIATALVIIIQIVFHTFLIGFDKVLANDITHDMVVRLKASPEAIIRLKERLKEHDISVMGTKITSDDRSFVVLLSVKCSKHTDLDEVAAILSENEDVMSVTL